MSYVENLPRLALAGLGIVAALVIAPRVYTAVKFSPHIHAAADVPREQVAIVFGAGVWRSGRPTTVLYDRVATAADLYHQGKVRRLLLSGDRRADGYDEPAAMRRTALDLGVPPEALVLDYAGRSTYDTCYRAKTVFGLTRATLVTQRFHLPRALFICEALGLHTAGAAADRRVYGRRSAAFWDAREVFATANAWWEVTVTRPVPDEPTPLP